MSSISKFDVLVPGTAVPTRRCQEPRHIFRIRKSISSPLARHINTTESTTALTSLGRSHHCLQEALFATPVPTPVSRVIPEARPDYCV